MQVTATGHMREYLQAILPGLSDPILLIYPQSYSGCPKCNSGITIFRASITERADSPPPTALHQIEGHKFPFDAFLLPAESGPLPALVVLGTRPLGGGHEMVVRKVTYPNQPTAGIFPLK